jgi:hypothetical protein
MTDNHNRRKNDRVFPLKPTRIELKGTFFLLHDINNQGLGIFLEKDGPQFVTGERIDSVPIPLQAGTVNINGIVSHLSVTSKCRICGIRFLFNGDEFKSVIQFKKELLQSSPD